jgi:hypothetical protein
MFSALQVIFLFAKQENNLIRALICGPKSPVWIAGLITALEFEIFGQVPGPVELLFPA